MIERLCPICKATQSGLSVSVAIQDNRRRTFGRSTATLQCPACFSENYTRDLLFASKAHGEIEYRILPVVRFVNEGLKLYDLYSGEKELVATFTTDNFVNYVRDTLNDSWKKEIGVE